MRGPAGNGLLIVAVNSPRSASGVSKPCRAGLGIRKRWRGKDAYDRLRLFAERQSHSQVPASYRDDDGFRLVGSWVSSQRARRDQLSEERRQLLEAVPGWAWDKYEAAWEDGYEHLRSFVERQGHSRVPAYYRDEDGFRLGRWVVHQREFRRGGKLSNQRQRRLEAVPGWVWDARKAG